jgi:RNA polymerase sigma-70 factor (ECF subfamily)
MNPEEKIWIARLKAGNKPAFEYFFYRYYQSLLRVTCHYLNDQDEAEEIVQEVFYRVWLYRESMNPELSFKAYIITIAKRLIFNKARKKLNQLTYEKYLKNRMSEPQNQLQDYLDFSELDELINHRIAKLPPKRKEIFILSRQQGLSHKEIAEKLNISPNTVESQITKAIHFIREALVSLVVIFGLT